MRHVYWLILSLSCCAALLVGSWQLLALSAQGATKPAQLLQRATPTAQPAAEAAPVIVTVVADSLRAALSQVRHAVSENQAWPSLTGVLFEIGDDGARIMATDGVRLAVRGVALVGTAPPELRALLPATLADELLDVLDGADEQVVLVWLPTLNRVQAHVGGARFDAPLLAGRYPDISPMLNLTYTTVVTLERAALLTALHANADLLRSASTTLSMGFSRSNNQGQIELAPLERISVGAQWPRQIPSMMTGPPQNVLLNGRLLAAAVRSLHSTEIVFDLRGPRYPLRIRSAGEALHNERILMPMDP